MAVLPVDHDMDLGLSAGDRRQVIEHGKLLASGSLQEIQRDEHVIAAYLGTGMGKGIAT